ncbi:hypothetical protein ACP4OV_011741 [Aristida adscensionis]
MHRPAAMAASLAVAVTCCCFFLLLAAHARGEAASASCVPRERDALLAFKHGITYDPAGLLTSWRPDGRHGEQADCCRWRGVRCSNRTGNVLKLRLRGSMSARLVGQISPSLLALEHLKHLDLSYNDLEGPTRRLPQFLGSFRSLKYHLRKRASPAWQPTGSIPLRIRFLSREMGEAGILDFGWELFSLTSLQFLDLARNKFSGRLPTWIGNASLRILRLSHNKFSGNISVNITALFCLQYMDLSNNEISGPLPRYLSNLEAMRTGRCFINLIEDFSAISLSAVFKGQELNYGTIRTILYTNITSMDVSSNNLSGEIPEEITALDALLNLNLSWNQFNGVVPNKIGQMQSLESLDLSRNELSGEIPATLSSLTFLSYLDLSYNNLTVRIPSGPQLDTLYVGNPSIYAGNVGLCGRPLQKNCSNQGEDQGGLERTQEGHGIEFYLGLGCGFIVGNWVAFGVLLFKRSWRIAYFQLPNKLYDKVYLLIATWAGEGSQQTD